MEGAVLLFAAAIALFALGIGDLEVVQLDVDHESTEDARDERE